MTKPAPKSAPAKPSRALQTRCDPDNPLGLPGRLDPADYDWFPVARRKREDGWSHARQRKFIEVLADTGSVRQAALAAQMSQQSCYRLRRSPGAEAFARAWDAAIEEASRRLIDIAFERAVQGVADPVFDKDGACIAVRRKYNDRLLMFLLRAHHPDRYRHAHADLRHAGEAAPAPAAPVAAALDLLEPPRPADPAALVAPEELQSRLITAELLGGKRPGWTRDARGDCDVAPEQLTPDLDQQLARTIRADSECREPEPDRDLLDRRSHLL